MKLPKKITVAGHVTKIELSQEMASLDGHMGASNANRNLIRIDTTYPDTRQAETLLHEICHMVFHQTCMSDLDALKAHEEYIVGSLSSGLYQVLRENKLHFDE